MEELNLILFDKYRQMGRLLRIGRSPGELVAGGGEAGQPQHAEMSSQQAGQQHQSHQTGQLSKAEERQQAGQPQQPQKICAADGQSPGACTVHHRDIILSVLSMNGSGMRQKDLAEEMCVSASTLSQMIRKLEEEHLIERKPDPTDRRAAILDMTEAGRARAAVMEQAFEKMLQYLFRNLSGDDKREMIRLFDLILEEEATC